MPSHYTHWRSEFQEPGLAWFTAAAFLLVMISAVPFKSQHKNTTMTTITDQSENLCTDFEIMDVNVSTLMLTPRAHRMAGKKKAEKCRTVTAHLI